MSAYIMSRGQLSDLAKSIEGAIMEQSSYRYINRKELKNVFGKDFKYRDIYRELYRINATSVNERYIHQGANASLTDEPAASTATLNDGQFLMSLECWLYQSCEFEGWQNDPTYKAVFNLKNDILEHIAHNTEHYKAANWSYC